MTRIVLCHPAHIGQAQAAKLEERGMIVLWTQGLPAGEPVRVLKPIPDDDEVVVDGGSGFFRGCARMER